MLKSERITPCKWLYEIYVFDMCLIKKYVCQISSLSLGPEVKDVLSVSSVNQSMNDDDDDVSNIFDR